MSFIERLLGAKGHDLTAADIEQLVETRTGESQRLDFKEQSWDSGRTFAIDVAAAANGGGGVIVVGIEEAAGGTAAATTPIALPGVATKLRNQANQLIAPWLPFTTYEVRRSSTDGHGYLVIEVPPSLRTPFAVSVGDKLDYPRRTGKTTTHLSESEVAAMYERRRIRLDTMAARADGLVRTIPETAQPESPPLAYVVAVPTDVSGPLFRPGWDSIDRISRLSPPTPFGGVDMAGRVFLHNSRTRFKRVDVATGFDSAGLHEDGWLEIHDDGAFLGVIPGAIDSRPDPAIPWGHFHEYWITGGLTGRLQAYGALVSEFSIFGEGLVRIGLASIGGPTQMIGRRDSDSARRTTVTKDLAVGAAVDLSTLTSPRGVVRTAAPLIGDLLTAFGIEESRYLSPEGSVRLNDFSSGDAERVAAWAKRHDIPTDR